MKIQAKRVVELTYTMRVDGAVADSADASSPLDYIHGTHTLLEAFETVLEGKEPGDEFNMTLAPAQAFGPYDPSKRIHLPKESFMVEGVLHSELMVVGRRLPMLDAYGNVVQGLVTAADGDGVEMDFNHPYAGKDVEYSGRILSVREATAKELEEGLHGEFLPPEEGHCCGKGRGGCHGGGCHGGGGHGHGGCHGGEEGEGCCHGEGQGEGCCHGEGHGEGCCDGGGQGEGCCHGGGE